MVSLNVCEREIEEMVSGERVRVGVLGRVRGLRPSRAVDGEGLEVRMLIGERVVSLVSTSRSTKLFNNNVIQKNSMLYNSFYFMHDVLSNNCMFVIILSCTNIHS